MGYSVFSPHSTHNPKPPFMNLESVGFSSADLEEKNAQSTYLRLRRDALSSGFIGAFISDKRVLNGSTVDGFNDVFGLDFRSNIGTDTIFIGILKSLHNGFSKRK